MHVHPYERAWMWAAGVMIGVGMGTILYGSLVQARNPPSHVETNDPKTVMADPRFARQGVTIAADGSATVTGIAMMFAFLPREIRVPATQKALATWTDKIRQKIRSNIIYDLSRVPGNPKAVFDVSLLPSGEVLTVNKRKSSGNPGYDEAVERAIYKASPLPKPDSPSLFRRQLELHFRPQDQ